ncbi:tetraacyldisaccharide 4'-kinase [Idiomarina seosinensis]|uniref:Tetraacyldisaccharide 4'-kinase n=1 Tax=Idiomarina seosinensis TaxID=281739 RepID=A0A432ZIN6_9GAMM|nr:tetraacyldisaccharide 4'-kinase [Idiomarina seosinensis]RUO77799.1 tetraacyldisaccharide 4'-kinase [Idiomarina seosinensis]
MWLQHRWYDKRLHPLLYLLTPLSLLFWLLTNVRRSLYWLRVLPSYRAGIPVIVVGNISVGGTGKTPMTLALVKFLREEGFNPGIVSRGYGANTKYPHDVQPNESAKVVGDEPLMLRKKSDCPVVISPKRGAAIKELRRLHSKVDIIVSDDGLQHYAMKRDIELILIDAERGVGNGWLLPCGPLREGPWRLKGAEWVVSLYAQHPFARYVCKVESKDWYRVKDDKQVEKPTQQCYAVAGIGNPHRFFHSLRQQQLDLADCIEFADHHEFSADDFAKLGDKPVLMTEKDAAKCRDFAASNWYYQPIETRLPDDFTASLAKRLRKFKD